MTVLTSPITAFSVALHLLVGVIVAYLLRAQGWDGLLAAWAWLLPLTLLAPAATAVIVLAVRRHADHSPGTVPKPIHRPRRRRTVGRRHDRRLRAAKQRSASRPLTQSAQGR